MTSRSVNVSEARHGVTSCVIAVDRLDRPIGVIDKLDAHVAPGVLHRAFSVFVVDVVGRVLLQRRAASKYHFAGRWSNSCCSHQLPGESTEIAARRRLREELGIEAEEVAVVGRFEYRAADPSSGLVEHELDHVVVATTSGAPTPSVSEADRVAWVSVSELVTQLADEDQTFTPWLRPALEVLSAAVADDASLAARYPAIASCAVGMRFSDVSAAVAASAQKSMTC